MTVPRLTTTGQKVDSGPIPGNDHSFPGKIGIILPPVFPGESESCSVVFNSLRPNSLDYIVHGILQDRILQWVAVPFSRESSQPRDWTQVSHIAGRFFSHKGSPRWHSGKEPACQWGDPRDLGLIPGSGRSSREGNSNPLQYSCLENPMDRGA